MFRGFSRVTGLLAAALVWGVGLTAAVAAQVSDQSRAVSVDTITPERTTAIVAVVVGLIGAVIGGLALVRSTGRLGTGNGLAGGIVAMMVGLIGMAFGGLALARSRRTV